MGKKSDAKNERYSSKKLEEMMIAYLQSCPDHRSKSVEAWNYIQSTILGEAEEGKKYEPISKGTKNLVKKRLVDAGIINNYKRSGFIVLNEKKAVTNTELSEYEKLNVGVLKEWLIIYTLGQIDKESTTAKEITNAFLKYIDTEYDAEEREKLFKKTDSSIRHYLDSNLLNKDIVEKIPGDGPHLVKYKLSSTAPVIIKASFDQLEQYLRFYNLESTESANDEVADKINWLLWGGEPENRKLLSISGKLNRFQENSLINMDKLLTLPYKTRKIAVRTNSDELIISVGLIFYSPETNEFYILGIANKKEIIIRMSLIKDMKKTNHKNEVYGSSEISEYFNEMYGIETDNLSEVKIRFRNEPYVKTWVDLFTQGRQYANVIPYNNGKELLYTDKIRGLGQLARTLRAIGADAIVEEPASLRKTMMDTTDKIENCYSDN